MVRSVPSPLLVWPGRGMPDVVCGRSSGGAAAGPSDRGAVSNSFDCGGYGRLRYVEKDDGLKTSAMMVKLERRRRVKMKVEVKVKMKTKIPLIHYPTIYSRTNVQRRSSPEASRVR